MEEIWKDIKEYEGYYQVSNWGRIKSLPRNSTVKYARNLKLRANRHGYLYVVLCKNGKVKTYYVHRLVAEAFIPNTDNLPCVNHKDENPLNNNVDNLEWCSYSYNSNYGTAIEKRSKKLSKPVLQYTLDGEFVKEWESIAECGRNGFNPAQVCMCCQGKKNKHKDSIWKYK